MVSGPLCECETGPLRCQELAAKAWSFARKTLLSSIHIPCALITFASRDSSDIVDDANPRFDSQHRFLMFCLGSGLVPHQHRLYTLFATSKFQFTALPRTGKKITNPLVFQTRRHSRHADPSLRKAEAKIIPPTTRTCLV